MTRFLQCLTLIVMGAISLIPSAANATEAIIGKISAIEGHATRQSAEEQQLILGDDIYMNDQITMGEASKAKIDFVDGTQITLGENAFLKIDEYIFDPADAENSQAEFNIFKGAFHYISGEIAKRETPKVQINLDFGSIGIRGTKIWRDMVLDDEGQPMCRIYVEDGAARVSNKKGFTTLKHGDGTKIRGLLNAPTPSKPWGEAAIQAIKAKTALAE